ncbi:hypothetical protein A3781_00685 [Bacillus badius]|nr:hypothetical protein A3781_00685 [Bacillus badius]
MDGSVAFHSRRFAFRGAGGEPPRRPSACGVSPVPQIPPESARLPFQSTGLKKIGSRMIVRIKDGIITSMIKLLNEKSAVLFIWRADRPVAFHSRRFAFRGAGGEPPRRPSACGVSPVPQIPPESAHLPFQSTGLKKIGSRMIVRIKDGIITSMIKLLNEKSAVLFIWRADRPVAFHSRRFAFRGAGGELPRRQSACGVSPVPQIPPESAHLPFQSTGCIKIRIDAQNA